MNDFQHADRVRPLTPSAPAGRRRNRSVATGAAVLAAMAAVGACALLPSAAAPDNGTTPVSAPVAVDGTSRSTDHVGGGSTVPTSTTTPTTTATPTPDGGAAPATTRAPGPADGGAAGTGTAGPPAQVRDVDFTNFTYAGPVCDDGAAGSVTTRDGVYEFPDNGLRVRIEQVQRGDLTGDGKDEAAVTLTCTGASSSASVQVFTIDPGAPSGVRRLGPLEAGRDPAVLAAAGVRQLNLGSATIEAGDLVTGWMGFADDDPECCPTRTVTLRHRWEGGAWTRRRPDGEHTSTTGLITTGGRPGDGTAASPAAPDDLLRSPGAPPARPANATADPPPPTARGGQEPDKSRSVGCRRRGIAATAGASCRPVSLRTRTLL